MNKLTVFALSFSVLFAAVLAVEFAREWTKTVEDCKKEKCQWECTFKKLGLFNDKSQMNEDAFIKGLLSVFPNQEAKVKDVVVACKGKVESDGCKGGKLVGECIVERMDKAGLKLPEPRPST